VTVVVAVENKKYRIHPAYMIEKKNQVRPGQYEIILRNLPNLSASYKNYTIKVTNSKQQTNNQKKKKKRRRTFSQMS
jgi:hypothetical protein